MMILLTASVLAVTLFPLKSEANSAPEDKKLKILAISGGYNSGSDWNSGIGWQLSYARTTRKADSDISVFRSLNFTAADEIAILGKRPQEKFRELSSQIGWILYLGKLNLALGCGIGYSWGIDRGRILGGQWRYSPILDHERKSFGGLSIPLQIDIYWAELQWLGGGISLMAKLSGETNMVGVHSSIQFGSLK